MNSIPPTELSPLQKYQLELHFDDQKPGYEARVIEAEELLREELWTGIVSGHEMAKGRARVAVITAVPTACLADVVHRLNWLGIHPIAASSQPVREDRRREQGAIGTPKLIPLTAPAALSVH